MVLNEIIEHKRREIEELKRRLPISKVIQMAEKLNQPKRSLFKSLTQKKNVHLICELKKASPSEGVLRENFKPKALAQEFEAAGASAISVLTERHYFKGDPKTLKLIRPVTTIPLIQKDFILDPYQIYEAALLGADAFLLIALLLTDSELTQMLELARNLKLETLVEVHTKEELNRALSAGSEIIGINNRNLQTLTINPSISENLIRFIPKDRVAVVESGINTRKEIERYQSLGIHCFLIGTTLMKTKNVKQKILELRGQSNGVL